jgi:LPXTG-site transpeptidase (sortase) family protein
MKLLIVSLQRTASMVFLMGFILFFAFALNLIPQDFKELKMDQALLVKNVLNPVKNQQVNYGPPIRLTIPKIKVNAIVKYVGVTPQGAMDVPKGPTEVAWLNLGPRPGEVGSAVISGHYGWKNNIPAVFDNLNKLQKGDKIHVRDEKGVSITFVVRELKTFGENQDATIIFTSTDGKSHLNLITCKGIWNKNKKSYSNRLIVFADKEVK